MVNLLREEFREVEIKGCRFHLGQACYRKIQSLGLAQDYKDKSSEIGKWLLRFFGLPFLPPDETKDSFIEEMIPGAPTNDVLSSDYLLLRNLCGRKLKISSYNVGFKTLQYS